ncbi:ribonuclease H-like domain-containing protein [Actinoplanes sp. NPDC049802]|uniref:ribonuclease H-like domain-containing protein n=1 Tax=Actinoplanes sp. NPDC049802 TaxID=3154742 RepID=UPI0033E9417A
MLLGGYEAFRCPVRVWWDHLPGAALDSEASSSLQRRFDGGNVFEEQIFAELSALHGPEAVLVGGDSTGERVEATLDAMRSGRRLVLGGQLPHDRAGGRVGKPDILLRVTADDEPPRYVPVDVKHYRQFGKTLARAARKGVPRYSTLADPHALVEVPRISGSSDHRFKACMQLTHYTRMLQACGFHPGPNWLTGAVIGTSDITDVVPGAGRWVLGWFDLNEPLFTTYSRDLEGPKVRSALDRYDHEFAFRLEVARKAAESLDDTARPVEPIRQEDCGDCPYSSRCLVESEGRAHRDITHGALSVREWKALGRLGIVTTADLAAVDLDRSDLVERLVPEVEKNEEQMEKRLGDAIRRARLIVAGQPWERVAPADEMPAADIEIDVDMENQQQGGLVYMWGIRKRLGQDDTTAEYVDDFHTWAELDVDRAGHLAERYFRWLQAQIADAEAAGKTIAFFHWTSPEVGKLRRHLPGTITEEEFSAVEKHHVDLWDHFRKRYFSVHGTGLKNVARSLGFEWPMQDAGGEHSLGVIEQAQRGDETARQWLRDYNHADTAATAHIRDALR